MKHLKYLLLLFIFIFTPIAYCYDYDVTNNITAPSGSGSSGGHYLGLEIYNTGSQNNYTVNTRYNGTLSQIIYNMPLPTNAGTCFTTNMEYTITMEMATSDWRNHFIKPFIGAYSTATNWSSSNVTFVSQKKIYFKFKIPSTETTCYDFVYVRLNSSSLSSTAFTGVTNWNLNKITLSDQYSSSGGGSSGGGSSSPTPNPNQNIIDNDNENTNNIIENNNQNTQNIIDNQNELLGNKCSNLLQLSSPYSITSDRNDYWTFVGNDFTLENGKIYYYSFSSNYDYGASTSTSSVEGYIAKDRLFNTYIHLTGKSGSFTAPSSGTYTLRLDCNKSGDTCTFSNFMISQSSSTYCEYGSYSSKLDETNNYLQDDSDPNISDSEFTSLFDSVAINNPLSSLLQLPVQFVNAIVNQTNSCQVVSLGTLLGVPITLPCIDIGSILGSTVWNTIDVLSSIGLIVLILKQLYESITNALTLGGYMDAKKYGLGYMSPLEFLCDVLTGFGGGI